MPLPGTLQQTGNRIDVTTLTPFNGEAASIASTGGSFITLLNIFGKGYLDAFYAIVATAGLYQVRVTIDGAVKVLLSSAALGNRPMGIVTQKELIPMSTAGSVSVRSPTLTSATSGSLPTLKPYPTIDASEGIIIIGSPNIYFYNSLLLEIATPNATGAYRYSGAYKS